MRELLEILRLSERMRHADHPSAGDLAARAILLQTLDETELARKDAEIALKLDPVHPDALLAGAMCLSASYAESLLASEFATDKARRRIIEYLDLSAPPRHLITLFPACLRLTVIWPADSDFKLLGMEKTDSTQILGRRQLLEHQWVISDHVFSRHETESREITACYAGAEHRITIPPVRVSDSDIPAERLPEAAPWILIPVFNGAKSLPRCLKSVARELDRLPEARALVIDDASTDPAIAPMLTKAAKHPRLSILKRSQNGGFVRSVNHGLAHVGAGSVLLLNSDTYLPPGTLARMMAHLEDPEIATVTPFSNQGGSFSLPQANKAFKAPNMRQADQLARNAAKLFGGQAVDVLTGNGFCMLISEKARKEVGPLSQAYEAGYYEEVDFCLRASQRGFRHLGAVDCFVLHVGSQSFGDRKRALVAQNQKRLYRRFAFYAGAYRRYRAVDPLKPYRDAIYAESGWSAQDVPQDMPDTPSLDLAQFETPIICMKAGYPPQSFIETLPKLCFVPGSWVERFSGFSGNLVCYAEMQGDTLALRDKDQRLLAKLSSAPTPSELEAFTACAKEQDASIYATV